MTAYQHPNTVLAQPCGFDRVSAGRCTSIGDTAETETRHVAGTFRNAFVREGLCDTGRPGEHFQDEHHTLRPHKSSITPPAFRDVLIAMAETASLEATSARIGMAI